VKLHKDSIDRFFDYDLHAETRTIFVGDSSEEGVDALMAERVIKALHLFVTADPQKEIRIILNSAGGFWTHGMAIYDAIKSCPAHITVEVYGNCMSMASIILQAADERLLHPNATFMIHDGQDGYVGIPKSFEAWADYSKMIRKKMYKIYAEKSGKSVSFWEKKCVADFILNAEETVAMGLADKVVGTEEK
jgi:ATP-dependent Clp protease protease subunit